MLTNLLDQAKSLQQEIVSLRRHLHSKPELSYCEQDTAKFAAEKLAQLGYKTKTGVAKTGVIADFGSGTTIAIRADMDALPIQEATGVDYQSQNQGIMHACGHDAHVACALTAAKLLAQEKLPGKVRFLLQPAEERGDEEGISGAPRMITDGALENVSAVIALHMDASLPAGQIGLIPGPTMAAVDIFKIEIYGKGGHGGYPESTIDSVVLAAHVILAIQQIVSRRISALEPAIITIGSVQSTSIAGNVISDRVTLKGTMRSFSESTRKILMTELEKACGVAKVLGGDYQIKYDLGYPATVNDPIITEIMRNAASCLIGPQNVIAIPPKTWSEDFAFLAQKVPGAYMFLGCEIKGDRRSHHSSNFDIDESGLYIGSAILAETAKQLMSHFSSKDNES